MDVTEFGIDALGIDLPVVDDGSDERAMLLSVIDELDDFFGIEPAVLSVAVAPVGYRARTGMVANVLVTFGKQTACQQISLTAFARSRGLTPTESRVLESLANGHTTQETAREHGIAISTIRTHIRQVLYKTGCTCLRDLLCQVSRLPPIRSKIRPLQRSADSHANR